MSTEGVDSRAAQVSLDPLPWDYETVLEQRRTYMSPSLSTFQAYDPPLLLKKGRGQYLWDADDRQYIDCLAQNVCISVGYAHPLVTEAVKQQLDDIQHVTTMWMHPAPGALAKELVKYMPATGEWIVHFVNSGSEAIDLAMLLARTHTGRPEIVTLRRSYHGLHFGVMTATGLSVTHQPVPPAPGIIHVTNPDQYRGIYGPGSDPYIAELKATLESSTTGGVAGFLFEPIQGYGGVIPLPTDYVRQACELIRRAGGLVIADEVQTGFGRTGDNFWGYQAHVIDPDIVVMAKGIGNGFPLAAVATRREIAESMTHRKFFNTYGSNPISCTAGRAVLAVIEAEGLQENAKRVGALLVGELKSIQKEFECIGDVRGQGLMLGVDIVSDRERRTPAPEVASKLHYQIRDGGVIAGRGGADGNVLRICPPLCITEADAGAFGEIVRSAFANVQAAL
jgi:alanine-glyoxylate transaminase/(R)-3-amino-2-methylpropionate-pyruvate transaminase